MIVTPLDMADAFVARLQRIQVANGYRTDAGTKVVKFVEKISAAADLDGQAADGSNLDAMISVTYKNGDFPEYGESSRYFDYDVMFHVGGFIRTSALNRIEPRMLIEDIFDAVFRKPIAGDYIDLKVGSFAPLNFLILGPDESPDSAEHTLVIFTFTARWCAGSLGDDA